ncbi:MAG TPA: guanosine-3',5'-bis(diphosphate) 3'-diphosphatase [Succinivibrionaceae bacterium]|nr:bifunctional GTP diphosphokinase/guanosine-3',5'-bis pyrophosphate 3'-pyrophosphohydrolase [Succinivibrio sp.]HAR80153.1 guanosine-3',5'-bis(diphosphate) 3'-diphosphatase [Succinivibrionaceae bacterium]
MVEAYTGTAPEGLLNKDLYDIPVTASPNFSYYAPLRNYISTYLPPQSLARIDKAFVVADLAHIKQFRASGEPYIIHPIAVALIISKMRLDQQSIMAALLHDVIEDTSLDEKDMELMFGPTVKDLVEGVTKLDKIRFHDYREAQSENFRKMILAMTKDIRVILIKLADRTHNMRTLGALRPDKRKRIARETLDVFAPIANRLGISDIKSELEELGMAALYPMRYRVLKSAVTRARNNRREVLNEILKTIKDRLDNVGLQAKVYGREKHIYSIYRKMVQKELKFREIMDVYAFRIILNDVDTCYRVLGQVHNLFKPRPGGFKDYIAIPKMNGYQSLHTSLVGPHGVPLEIQIRTEYMDQLAAKGVAAHWAYKENGSEPVSSASQKNAQQWIRNLIDLQNNASSSEEFVEDVKTDLFPDSIFVFTPEGKIYDLPSGATPVDFAFAVHTDIGMHCIGSRVNHHIFPLSHPLQSGQSVEIITSHNAQPNAIWLSSVVTSKARSKIRQFLKSLRSQECELIGRRLLQNTLRNVHLEDIDQNVKDAMLKELKKSSMNELFVDIALGNILTVTVAKLLVPSVERTSKGLPIIGTEGMPYTIAQCCYPIPGDEIVAHIATGRGLVIHNINCNNIKDHDTDPTKYLKVSWDLAVSSSMEFQTSLSVVCDSGTSLVSEITNAIEISGSHIQSILAEDKGDSSFVVNLVVSVRDRLHLAGIIKRIKAIKGVSRINRKK